MFYFPFLVLNRMNEYALIHFFIWIRLATRHVSVALLSCFILWSTFGKCGIFGLLLLSTHLVIQLPRFLLKFLEMLPCTFCFYHEFYLMNNVYFVSVSVINFIIDDVANLYLLANQLILEVMRFRVGLVDAWMNNGVYPSCASSGDMKKLSARYNPLTLMVKCGSETEICTSCTIRARISN